MDDNTIALKIFDLFHNRTFHVNTAHNHVRAERGFESVSFNDVMRAVTLLFKLRIIDLDHSKPHGVCYLWTEVGEKVSFEQLSIMLESPLQELRIPLEISLEQEHISELVRTERAHIIIHLIENELRKFISNELEKIDKNWLENRVDEHIRRSWESKKRKEKKQFPWRNLIEHELIFYSDFNELKLIMTKDKNWSQVFNKFFGKIEGIQNRIAEVEGIRHTVMHNRIISDEDLKWLKILYQQILTCIRN